MSDSSSHPTLSAHEILRFSIEQPSMSVRHVGLHQDRVFITLRDNAPEKNLWELVQVTGGAVRLTPSFLFRSVMLPMRAFLVLHDFFGSPALEGLGRKTPENRGEPS
jgi:hypothetical protein